MKMFKNDGKEHIPADNPIEVNLERALREVDKFPTVEGNFIGFFNEKDETIHFMRGEENSWFIDVPIVEEDTYSYSLQDNDLTTEAVKGVIERFFRGEDWKPLCNLRSSKREPPSDKTKRRIEIFREVGDEGAEMMSEEILSKEEFIKKLENFPNSSDNTTYGIIAELSKPFVMVKKPSGKWEVRLDLENQNIDIEISENEKGSLDFEEIDDIKKWVNEKF
ncbi:MAG: hypothetical protein OEY40_02935 [Candidatus Bathyarchaeota archaeon]|nr:hypothetical protein [Candidatus Bathyarchaeota archaeon]